MKLLTIALFIFLASPCLAQVDPLLLCLTGLSTDPRFAPIASKVAIGTVSETTFPMLADSTLANNSEKKTISDWAAARKDCVKAGDDYWKTNYPPQIHALAIEAENNMMANAAEIYNRKITFGEFNKRRQSLADELRIKVAAIVQQILSERDSKQQALQQARDAQEAAQQRDAIARQEAQRQFEQAKAAQEIAMRRQAALQIFLRNTRPPEPFQPVPFTPMQIPKTTTTNCYTIGNQWQCTTR